MENSMSAGNLHASDETLKCKSDDIGWEFGELVNPENTQKVKCKLCNRVLSGGVFRLKQHIARVKGNVVSCDKSTPIDQLKCKRALEEVKRIKENKRKALEDTRMEVNITENNKGLDDCVEIDGINKQARQLGPIDQFTRAISSSDKKRQQNISEALFKSRTNEVHTYLACWVYESGIPFNSINNDGFRRFVEAVGQFGPGYIPATQYQLREPLLKQAVKNTMESMKKQENEWKDGGCSIMTDAWSDRKRRSIMNLCVNCKIGTSFLSSIECSLEAHTGKYIFDYVDKWIDNVGSKNVIQIVTDNATNNFAAGRLLKQKRPNIFWTACAAHTINLVLEAIGKTLNFKLVIDKAKSLTVYIYAHHKTLALMRKFTKQRDIVRPGVTRFASSFLTMQSMLEKQESLKYMFLSSEWSGCKWATQPKAVEAYSTIVSQPFWTNLSFCVEVFKPLVKLLRLVDGDLWPSMGFIYGEIKETKKEVIRICNDAKEMYNPILYIIESRMKDRLDGPLHLTGYLLNPYYYYRDDEVKNDSDCMGALLTCVEAFFPDDFQTQNLVSNIELHKYKAMEGIFSRKLAISGRIKNDDNFNPVAWWSNYGSETPNLQRMAMKILGLTTSSSGCERNWSVFEGIHTKKRNRLDSERLNDLVYVKFNSKLINKNKKLKDKCDPLLANDARMAQEWIVEGDHADESEGSTNTRTETDTCNEIIRELDEDDFLSDEEESYCNDDFMFGDLQNECW